MAKITFYKSPIDKSDKVEIVSKGTLRYALKQLGIEREPLSVRINGMIPDEVDLDEVLGDNDNIEIFRPVHGGGGGNADTKRAVATVVQIAAIAAAMYLTAGGASVFLTTSIMIGGSIVSGALNKWAQDLMAAKTSSTDSQELGTQTNDYSLRSATNKARPLASIPVPIGSHRMAPDVHTEPFIDRYAQDNTVVIASPYTENRYSGITQSNGPMAANNSWITMPAGWLYPAVGGDPATAIPRYPIKIAPYSFTDKTTPLTPEEQQDILDYIKDKVTFEISDSLVPKVNWTYYFLTAYTRQAYPIIIYHFDSNDPYRGRFNLFWSLLMMAYVTVHGTISTVLNTTWNRSNYWDALGHYFNGTDSSPVSLLYTFSDNFSTPTSLAMLNTRIFQDVPTYYPSTINDMTLGTYMSRFSTFLLSLNGGSYTTTNKTTSPQIPTHIVAVGVNQTYAGIPISTQLFNYGFGDLDISQRYVGTASVDVVSPRAGFSTPERTNPLNQNFWLVKELTGTGIPDLPVVQFRNEVKNFPPKALINPDIYNLTVDPSDNGTYNFIYFSGRPGLPVFKFSIAGRVYRTSSSGFLSNSTRIQVQFRSSGSSMWTNYQPSVITIENNKPNYIYITYVLIAFAATPEEWLEVRIRKINMDNVDNMGDRVSELSIVDACFHDNGPNNPYDEPWKRNIPMNIEGLFTTALISDSSTTNQFSALVEAKCWVYDFDTDTWAWQKTRNPAWWFLYFARGGFRNESALGNLTYPYSPTYGWVNYPGHPDNDSHMFGGGYTDDQIDIDKIKEWAFFCDEQNLKIDMIIKDDVSVAEILERIANVGRASVSYNVGKLSVVIEDPQQVPVAMFGMGNIISGSFSVNYAVGDPVRKIIGVFTNRETWETDRVEAIVPFSDSDIVREVEVVMDGITEKSQAQREVNIMAARQFYQRRTYSWETDIEGYLVKRGDIVMLAHDSTQFGFSGRIIEFIASLGAIVGIKTGANLDPVIEYVTIRSPLGELSTYKCHIEGDSIIFDDPYPIEKAPFIVNLDDENADSDFAGSIAEDFVFIADIKNTPGKRVRIASVEVSEDSKFKFTAVDEDPAMWSYEYNDPVSSESFNDAIAIAEVLNFSFSDLGNGRIRLFWETSGADLVQVINLDNGLPLESGGQYSFSSGDVVFELIPGVKYNLEARPLTYGPSIKRGKTLTLWPL